MCMCRTLESRWIWIGNDMDMERPSHGEGYTMYENVIVEGLSLRGGLTIPLGEIYRYASEPCPWFSSGLDWDVKKYPIEARCWISPVYTHRFFRIPLNSLKIT